MITLINSNRTLLSYERFLVKSIEFFYMVSKLYLICITILHHLKNTKLKKNTTKYD